MGNDPFLYMNGELEGEGENVCLGYTDKPCTNCGRVRVEQWSDGSRICEKCNFNQGTSEYVYEHRKFI